MQIDLSKYPEKCETCGEPARTELMIEEFPFGHEWFQFCINPRCIDFDGANLKKQRDQLEKRMRNSKGFQRHRRKLWKKEIKTVALLRKERIENSLTSQILRQAQANKRAQRQRQSAGQPGTLEVVQAHQ